MTLCVPPSHSLCRSVRAREVRALTLPRFAARPQEDESALRRRAQGTYDGALDLTSHATSGPRAQAGEEMPWPDDDLDAQDAYERFVALEADEEGAAGEAFYPQPVLVEESAANAAEESVEAAAGGGGGGGGEGRRR